MRIVLVNYRYFVTGGPERYLFNISALLEKNGHEVIPFSIKHKDNIPSEWERYFASPIGKGDVTYFSDSKKSDIFEIFKFFTRMFYSFEVRNKFRKLILDTNPDLVYVLHYQNKMSPSFVGVAKRRNIPVIQRISDFGHICANQLFYNYRLNSVCEKCLNGSKLNAVKYRCVYESFLYSLIKILALKFHEFIGVTKKIDAFVVPSRFTASKLKAFGIPDSKLIHLPTFFSFSDTEHDMSESSIEYGTYALYIGRIEEEKGIMTLVKAFEGTKMHLKIVGDSSKGYDKKVQQYLDGKDHNIEFTGRKSFNQIKKYLSECAFTICPSECYDNLPNSVIESFAYNKAVICTNLGSLKELVEHNLTGLLYEPSDHIKLREYCLYMLSNKTESERMGRTGRIKAEIDLSESGHYNSLIALFSAQVKK